VLAKPSRKLTDRPTAVSHGCLGRLNAPRAVRELNMAMSPVELGTKSHRAGESQQQFSSPSVSRELRSGLKKSRSGR
jgi:hypothetical protein